MEEEYNINHDFGYGKEQPIQKLTLRNYNDFRGYLAFCLNDLYSAKVHGNTLDFGDHVVQIVNRHRMQ